MTDREMLLIAYGALKAVSHDESDLASLVHLVEKYLFEPKGHPPIGGLTDGTNTDSKD